MELFAQTMSRFNLRLALKPVSEIQIIIVLNLTTNLWLSVDVQDLLTTILNIEVLKGQTCILQFWMQMEHFLNAQLDLNFMFNDLIPE